MRVAIAILFLAASQASTAAGLPLKPELEAGTPAVVESAPMKGTLPSSVRTIFGVTAGKHSLDDVIKKLGKSELTKLDRADGRPVVVCYRAEDIADDTLVLFEAGPLGGFRQVTAISVGPAAVFGSIRASCSPNKVIGRKTATAGGIALGSPVGKVAVALKAPLTTTKDGLVEAAWEKSKMVSAKDSGKTWEETIASGFLGRTHQGVVTWFSIYFTRSR